MVRGHGTVAGQPENRIMPKDVSGYAASMNRSLLRFEGYVLRSGRKFESICPELDVASLGKTADLARRALVEACEIYMETAIESNLPYLRPIPTEEHPLHQDRDRIVERFMVVLI